MGRHFTGLDGVALAMVLGALVLAPAGIATAGSTLLDPHVLLVGLGVSLASSAVPYSLELVALRRLAPGVFGVLLSLEPAAAAAAGAVVLGQGLRGPQLLGIALVVAASIIVMSRPRRGARPAGAEPGA